jgi:hypothetical protein
VRGTLEGIQYAIEVNQRDVLNILGPLFGTLVIGNLPPRVNEFQYSLDFPEIRAERESGTESWDAEMAFQWAFDVEAGTEGRIPLNNG